MIPTLSRLFVLVRTAQRVQVLAQLGAQGGASHLNRHLAAMAMMGDVDLHVHKQAQLPIDAPSDAARRGVDVQLVLPSQSDFAPALHAGRRHCQTLLDAGVKLHELQDAVLHAKTAVIDGVVSTVGSSNMDRRSFAGNDEVNAVIFGEDFGDAMKAMFKRDVAAAQPITPQAWARRPWSQRAKEGLAQLFERIW